MPRSAPSIEQLGDPTGIIVESAVYRDSGGVVWAAGRGGTADADSVSGLTAYSLQPTGDRLQATGTGYGCRDIGLGEPDATFSTYGLEKSVGVTRTRRAGA